MAEHILINSPQLLQRISLSPVMLRLMQEAIKPEPDFAVMADTIRMDPALSATMLNLVNSAFYALPQKVTDLHRAALVLGSREILKMAVSMSLHKDLEQGFPDCRYDFFPDWRLIVWSSIAAEMLAARLCKTQADLAYLCCLLKDVSLLFLRCAAKELLPGPEQHEQVTVLAEGQLGQEMEAWGMHHGALSQFFLVRWGIPAEACEGVRHHHDLEGLSSHPPLVQAVILATRWSEVELGHAKSPFEVVQFEGLLRSVLSLTEREVDQLRSQCLTKFRSMLDTLGLGEGDGSRAFYRHSVKAMQGYCFLSMDLLTVEGGLLAVARVLGKHIRLNWDVKTWELALRPPHGEGLRLFRLEADGDLRQVEGKGGIPSWSIRSRGLYITAGGRHLGELRLGQDCLPDDELENLELYLRFFGQGFEHYCARQAVLEEKALAFDKIPVGVARLDGQGRVMESNGTFAEILAPASEPRGLPLAGLLATRLPQQAVAEFQAFLADGGRQSFGRVDHFSTKGADGAAVDGALYLSAHRVDGGRGILALLEDLRAISGLEAQALKRRNFLERLIASMQELVLTVSAAGVIEFCSRQDLGLDGKPFFKVCAPTEASAPQWSPGLLTAEGQAPLEAVLHAAGGVELPVELSFAPLGARGCNPDVCGEGQRQCLVVGRDLTQIRRLEAKLKVRAMIDSLTGLYNHYQFHATLEREVNRCRRTGRGLGLVFCDLDKFKAVNDTKGHLAGDNVLHKMGALLLHLVRQGMDFPCRYGGDEFAIIVTEVDKEGLAAIARRIHADVRDTLHGLVTVSVGASMLLPGDTPEALLGRADAQAYAAKKAGGDGVRIDGDN